MGTLFFVIGVIVRDHLPFTKKYLTNKSQVHIERNIIGQLYIVVQQMVNRGVLTFAIPFKLIKANKKHSDFPLGTQKGISDFIQYLLTSNTAIRISLCHVMML